MNLSPHFTLAELTLSQWAARNGVNNDPSSQINAASLMHNLRRLANALEIVRYALGCPVNVSSGYRAPEVNRAVGGSATSAHVIGLAADFTSPFGTPHAIIKRLLEVPSLEFDQLIHEYGRWVHIGLAPGSRLPRRQVLSIFRPGRYIDGLHEREPT